MNMQPVTLSGRFIRLEPMSEAHVDALSDVAFDPDLWRWTTSVLATREDVSRYIVEALQARDAGTALPFVTIDLASNRVVGSTRYGNADTTHRRVEIGWTFVAAPWQKSYVNTEAKYLMLQHAFDVLNCIRVEFKTDALNQKSRTALLRLGAKEEGTLRSHMIMPGGRLRDSTYYSILHREWFGVSVNLQQKLSRSGKPSS